MTELKCDFDSAALPREWWERLRVVMRAQRLTVDLVRVDRTTRGWHVLIVVRQRIAFARVVLIQSLLGSDWKRELFNSRRAIVWRHVPAFWRCRANVLYERHDRKVSI